MQENRKRDFVWVQKTVPKDAYAPLKRCFKIPDSAYKFCIILKYRD